MHSRPFRITLFILMLAFPSVTHCQPVTTPEQVSVPGTELRRIQSKVMGQEMLIHVQLPLDYVRDGSRKYPVWYMTDANRSFPLVANISTILGFPPTGFPQVIVIGIGYSISDMSDWAAWRTRDLTPVPHERTEQYWTRLLQNMTGDNTIQVESGKAKKFLGFILDELIPFIEKEYHVSTTDRTLGGYSYGGLFSLFSMFEQPGAFQKYYCGSPSLHYSDKVIFEIENRFSEHHEDLPAKVFMSVGGLEDSTVISDVRKMSELLESRRYPNFEVHFKLIGEEGHASAMPRISQGPASLRRQLLLVAYPPTF
jgi:predicted alpha/beta superfamily hydrolase